MPDNTPDIKIRNVKRNGGQVIWCEPNQISRDKALRKVLEDTGSILVHPYNDNHIICGQGTASLELMEECPDLDILVTPVSGGGLLGGTLCYAKEKQNLKTQLAGRKNNRAKSSSRNKKPDAEALGIHFADSPKTHHGLRRQDVGEFCRVPVRGNAVINLDPVHQVLRVVKRIGSTRT